MLHPIALLYLLLRMVRASQGIHASPDGYARGLSGEFQRRRCRSRRVRHYVQRVPFAPAEDDSAVDAEPAPVLAPAPRRPVDAVPQVDATSSTVRVPGASVAVPAMLVRGRCFLTGRETGARPVESRKLALTVLCALVDQEQARASVPAQAAGEGFALGQSPFLENSRLPRQGTFAGPFRPTGTVERAEFTASAERGVFAGGEVA